METKICIERKTATGKEGGPIRRSNVDLLFIYLFIYFVEMTNTFVGLLVAETRVFPRITLINK